MPTSTSRCRQIPVMAIYSTDWERKYKESERQNKMLKVDLAIERAAVEAWVHWVGCRDTSTVHLFDETRSDGSK